MAIVNLTVSVVTRYLAALFFSPAGAYLPERQFDRIFDEIGNSYVNAMENDRTGVHVDDLRALISAAESSDEPLPLNRMTDESTFYFIAYTNLKDALDAYDKENSNG